MLFVGNDESTGCRKKKNIYRNLDILLNHNKRRNDSALSVQVKFICNYRVKIHIFLIGMFLIYHSCYFCWRSFEQFIDRGQAECWKKKLFHIFLFVTCTCQKSAVCVCTQTDKQTTGLFNWLFCTLAIWNLIVHNRATRTFDVFVLLVMHLLLRDRSTQIKTVYSQDAWWIQRTFLSSF